jgi:hypothetical protein
VTFFFTNKIKHDNITGGSTSGRSQVEFIKCVTQLAQDM